MFGIKEKFKILLLKLKWHKKHPTTTPMNYFRIDSVDVGKWSYGELNVISFNNHAHLHIGSFVSIAQNVTFLLDVEHTIKTISTYPFKTKMLDLGNEALGKGDIIVDDDVWIGYGATILSGVHIGQGAVIAAGAVVTTDVQPYAIVGGVPAKVIRYRFEAPVIDYLLTLDYGGLDTEQIKTYLGNLYTPLNDICEGEIKEMYSWFPKKK